MKWLAAIVAAVVQALVALVARRSQPKAEDGKPSRGLRDRLRAKVRRHWMIWLIAPVLLFAGCVGTRTVYVRDGEPVRLRETVRRAKVWVLDADGQPIAGVMDLPEGWYALPVPQDDPPAPAQQKSPAAGGDGRAQ